MHSSGDTDQLSLTVHWPITSTSCTRLGFNPDLHCDKPATGPKQYLSKITSRKAPPYAFISILLFLPLSSVTVCTPTDNVTCSRQHDSSNRTDCSQRKTIVSRWRPVNCLLPKRLAECSLCCAKGKSYIMTAVMAAFGYEKCATLFEPRVCVSQIQTELLKMVRVGVEMLRS